MKLGAPATITTGVPISLTVTAQDACGNANSIYTGTVQFSSSDNSAGLPSNYTFTSADNGTHVFSTTLTTLGNQTITASDTVNVSLFDNAIISVTSEILPTPTPTATPTPTPTFTPTPTPSSTFTPIATPTPSPTPPTQSSYTYYLPFLASNYIPSGQSNSFTSYLALQNIGNGAASISMQFADPFGNNLNTSSIGCPTLAVNAECVPANPLPLGSKGTGFITSSQPLNVIVAEATPFGGSAYAVRAGASNSLMAPLAINGAFGGFTTQLTVYNGGTTATDVSTRFFRDDGIEVVAAAQTARLLAHTSLNLDQSASSSKLPDGFNGWAQISSPTGSQFGSTGIRAKPQ